MSILEELPPPPSGRSGWPWTVERQDATGLDASITDLPRFTVITPSLNQGTFLEEALRSVLLQEYPKLEYIVIDGGSTDESLEILERYEPWLSRWVSEPDGGQSQAINKGLRLATGEWVSWLNADDIYFEGALAAVANEIFRNPDVNWMVGASDRLSPDLLHRFSTFAASLGRSPRNLDWLEFLFTKSSGIGLPQPSSFWKRSLIEEMGGIDESFHYAMDHELYVRLAKEGHRPHIVERRLAAFRIHAAQKTALGSHNFLDEEIRVVDKHLGDLSPSDAARAIAYKRFLRRKKVIEKILKMVPTNLRRRVIGTRQ